jgi:hypothetical protein
MIDLKEAKALLDELRAGVRTWPVGGGVRVWLFRHYCSVSRICGNATVARSARKTANKREEVASRLTTAVFACVAYCFAPSKIGPTRRDLWLSAVFPGIP